MAETATRVKPPTTKQLIAKAERHAKDLARHQKGASEAAANLALVLTQLAPLSDEFGKVAAPMRPAGNGAQVIEDDGGTD